MRVIRVTVDRRHEGIRVNVAMSPSALQELVANGGEADFSSLTDDDVVLNLNLSDLVDLDPEREENEFVRMEFEPEVDEYPSIDEAE